MESSYPSTATTTGTETGTIRNGGERVVDRLATGAHAAVDRMASTAGPALDRMRETAQHTADSLQSRVGEMGEMRARAVTSARDYVRERPMTSIALAVLAGMVIARWMR